MYTTRSDVVPDNRLLAAAFELQRERPAAAVVLVTSDFII